MTSCCLCALCGMDHASCPVPGACLSVFSLYLMVSFPLAHRPHLAMRRQTHLLCYSHQIPPHVKILGNSKNTGGKCKQISLQNWGNQKMYGKIHKQMKLNEIKFTLKMSGNQKYWRNNTKYPSQIKEHRGQCLSGTVRAALNQKNKYSHPSTFNENPQWKWSKKGDISASFTKKWQKNTVFDFIWPRLIPRAVP